MRKIVSILVCLIIGIGIAAAQVTKVSGVVLSAEDGEPIVGASVMGKGTTTGTVTNLDGHFTLDLPQSVKELTVSYVGMKSQVVAVKPQLRILLQSASEELDEVVVTAMGISRDKKAVGYSMQEVNSEELTAAASTTLASALQGKVSGVDIKQSSGMPGASSQIVIRGARSFTGNNTPLYIVDGTPVSSTPDVGTGNSVSGSDFAARSLDLDPNDIASINVLKGQAASALYGMRASNGVVVITTKSGKGIAKGKPQITVGSTLAFDKLSTKPELQTEFAQGVGGAYNPTTSLSWGPKISELPNDPKYGGNTDNAYTAKYGTQSGKYFVPQRLKAGMDPWATPQSYNNVDDFFQTGVTWSNYANINQAFDRGNYAFSIGNTYTDGVVPSTGLNRYNVKMLGEAQLSNNWSTGFNGNFVTSKLTKQTGANNGIVATVFPAPPSYDLGGIPSYVEGDPYTQNTYRGTGGFDGAYWAVKNNSFLERSQRFFGNVFLKYTTRFNTDNHKLDLKYQLGNDAYTTNYKDTWGYGHSNGRGSIDEWHYTINDMNSLLTGTYRWDINEDFIFDGVLGNEWIEYSRKFTEAYGANFNFAGWNHMNNASVYSGSSSYKKERTVGIFGSLSLSYKNMLFLNATGRNDVVSTMPRSNRSFFYPSVSLGWIFTELEPLKNNVLTYGKLRGSYSEVGQAGQYYASYYAVPAYGGGFSSGTPILYPINNVNGYVQNSTVYDPALKPQNTVSWEIGTDLTFFNGLVNLNYTYSRQDVRDQIFAVPLAGSTGISSLMMNGGKIHTNSHEVTLDVYPIRTKNFDWSVGVNFTKLDNYVDELAEGVTSIFLGGFVEPQVRAGIGDKYPVIYGTSYLRNANGDIVVDANGLPQMGEEMVIGTVSPDFRIGFNTMFNIYGLKLTATLDWKQGGQMYSGTAGLLDYYGTSKRSGDYRKASSFLFEEKAVKVTATDADGNPTAYAPNDIEISGDNAYDYFSALNDISESMIYDNSFVKLREVSAMYPVYSTSKMTVNVSVFARNIIVWSQIKGLDPEATQGNNNMAGAFERFSLPGSSSYGFGINLNF